MTGCDADGRCVDTVAIADQALYGGPADTVSFVDEARREFGQMLIGEIGDFEMRGTVELSSCVDECGSLSVDIDRTHVYPVGASEAVPTVVEIQACYLVRDIRC